MGEKDMRFLDANIFIYAFYKARKPLSPSEKRMKDSSKEVINGTSKGKESVITTVIHLSEVVNILKYSFTANQLGEIVTGLLTLDNVEVLEVRKDDYFAAAELGRELGIDPNDALAVQVMRTRGVTEVYSYERVFDRIEGLTRVPSMWKTQAGDLKSHFPQLYPFRRKFVNMTTVNNESKADNHMNPLLADPR